MCYIHLYTNWECFSYICWGSFCNFYCYFLLLESTSVFFLSIGNANSFCCWSKLGCLIIRIINNIRYDLPCTSIEVYPVIVYFQNSKRPNVERVKSVEHSWYDVPCIGSSDWAYSRAQGYCSCSSCQEPKDKEIFQIIFIYFLNYLPSQIVFQHCQI